MDPVPAIQLSAKGGVIWVLKPPGAVILVDDDPRPKPAPAQLWLPPGPHRITLRKGDRELTETIDVKDGAFLIREYALP